jgi:hypothetical protein
MVAVHEELHQLSEALRVPFILCCLEGKGTTEAAEQLGMKLGTFSARRTRAKQKLVERLSARGVTAGVVALTALVGSAAKTPARVIERAIDVATMAGSVPANILSLTHGVLGMSLLNVKLLSAAVLVSCGLAAGVSGVWTANAQEPGKTEQKETEQPKKTERASEEVKLRALIQSDLKKRIEQMRETLRFDKEVESEFKYFGQAANFAPTAAELVTLVKRGEVDGYKFVGITNMKGTAKQADAVVPTLVFRRKSTSEVPQLGETQGLQRDLSIVLDHANGKTDQADLGKAYSKQAEAESDEVLQAEILTLRFRLAALEAQAAKKPAMQTVKFQPTALGHGDAKAHIQFLMDLIQHKYGTDQVRITIDIDPKDQSIVVTGEPVLVKWLHDVVQSLKMQPARK